LSSCLFAALFLLSFWEFVRIRAPLTVLNAGVYWLFLLIF
jgi:hypothetical protein